MGDLDYNNLLFSDDLPDEELEKLLARITEEPSKTLQPAKPVKHLATENKINQDQDISIAASKTERVEDSFLHEDILMDKGIATDHKAYSDIQGEKKTVLGEDICLDVDSDFQAESNGISDSKSQKLNDDNLKNLLSKAKVVLRNIEAEQTDTKIQPTEATDVNTAYANQHLSKQHPDIAQHHTKNLGSTEMDNEAINIIKQQIATLQSQIQEMTSQFFSANEASAKLIGQVRDLQLANPRDFALTYEQTQELRTKFVNARKQFLELTSLLDLVEEALENESYTKLTQPH